MKVECDNRLIASTSYTQFLGIAVENVLYWESHIDQLLPKLSAAWYAIRVLKPFVTKETFLMDYCDYFHSIMNYGIIFWGNSPYNINILM